MRYWVLLLIAAGCSTTPRTQVTAELTADPGIMAEAVKVRIVVRGRALGGEFTDRADLTVPVESDRWPLTHAMIPEGNNPQRQYVIEAQALDSADSPLAEARAISGYIAEQTLTLSMHFFDACRGVVCSETQTCNRQGVCETARRNVETLCQRTDCTKDAGLDVPDAGMDVPDVGVDVPPVCDPSECDDGVACTNDTCGDSGCVNTPDAALCIAAADGRCDPEEGCQYAACNDATCVPGPCQTATCDGDTCVREDSCGDTEECCGNACIALCEGGDCVTSVCDPETNACAETIDVGARCSDDGIFCNGAEFCSPAGACVPAGSPCGAVPCDEADGSCGGCGAVADCPPPPPPTAWGSCVTTSICGNVGEQTRTFYTMQCNLGSCDVATWMESQSCTVSTDGVVCDPPITGPCTRSCTQVTVNYRCSAGACLGVPEPPVSCAGPFCMGGSETECSDRIDNDGDDYTDCEDCDCESTPACSGMPCSEV